MKTRNILKTGLFLAGVIMLTASCNKKDDGPTLDFNIALPAKWNYSINGNEGLVYYAVSPVISTNDSITEDMEIYKYATDNQNLQTFYTSYVSVLAQDTSYHRISVRDTTVNGEEAIKLTHLLRITSVNQAKKDTLILHAKIQKYFMMNKNHGYVISFNALQTTFDEYHPIFDNIISTFTFKN